MKTIAIAAWNDWLYSNHERCIMNMLQRKPATSITLQLLACLTLVVLPHTPHLQPWIWLTFGGMIAWRAVAAIKHWPMPPRWLRLLLALAAMVAVYLSYGRINGQHGGVALLVVLLGMKLTEVNSFRDHVVVALLAYFVLISQFLFSQELVMVLWLIAGVWLITATLLSISHPQSALPYKTSMRRSASLLLQAAPLMLLCFFLFPRIPGPLWGVPSDTGAAKSGLSNSMSPGDIGHLVSTDEIAFRVRFEDTVPAPAERYWRGPVFDYFDGRTWRARAAAPDQPVPPPTRVVAEDNQTAYEVTLEPHRQRWMFLLDIPVVLPSNTSIQADGTVLAKDKINERRLYTARSALQYQLEPDLSQAEIAANLRLPANGNPRTRALARSWRAQGMNDQAILRKILSTFREQEYVYTLQPPTLGRHPVDTFLFDSRRGFCEHYASSFTFLMRAAGIPARIVTGYLGGEHNELGGYYILRQSDAHAWSEVWLPTIGWLRVDPTAAVAPERIEYGLASALPMGEAMAMAIARRTGDGLLRNLRMRWDWVNNGWYRWVLGYGPELQSKLLGRLGLHDWGQMILALTILGSAFLGGLGLLLIWQVKRVIVTDPVLRLWLDFCRKFSKMPSMQRLQHEGPYDYRDRLLLAFPEQESDIRHITQLYLRLRYGQAADQLQKLDNGPMQEFKLAVRQFKPR